MGAGGGEAGRPLVVLTTVNALIQRVPPRRLFDGRILTLGAGGHIPLDRLQSFSALTAISALIRCASLASSRCVAASSSSTGRRHPSRIRLDFSA